MRTAPTTALLVAITGAVVLSGCSTIAPTPQATTGAVSDGSFVLYSGRDEALMQPLIDQFEEATGIEVDVRYGNTAELGALLLEEGDSTPADVYLSQDAGALGALSKGDLFAPLSEEITSAVLPDYTSTDGSWVAITGRARVIVYDGAELNSADVPDSVDGFLDPEWKGRLGIAPGNASFQAFVTAYRVLNGEAAAEEWVAGIVDNEPQIFDNNRAILAAVNDGVLDAGLINHYYWFAQAAESGVDTMRAALAYPESGDAGSIVNVTGAGILASAARDADAIEFVRYLVSIEAQEYFVEQTFEYPLVPGIDSPEGLPSLESLVTPGLDLADLDSLAQTQALLAQYGLL